MKRTLIVTLAVDLGELPDEERANCAKLEECEPSDLPSLSDVDPDDVAECIQGEVENSEEMFAGWGLYTAITGVRIIKADWQK